MKHFFILLSFLLCSELIYGQFYERNNSKFVFSNEANIRESASVKAKIIGNVKQGKRVTVCNIQHVTDTINGIVAYWVPVLHNGGTGYIWGVNLSSDVFVHSNGNWLLAKSDLKGLSYKIFNKDSLLISGTYPDKPYHMYAHVYRISPLDAVRGNVYIKLSDSDIYYAFDGERVVKAGETKKENISSLHQSATEEVAGSLGSVINRDKVNLRSDPTTNSKILASLPKYAFVEQIKRLEKLDTINKEHGYWYKIKAQGKEGYVWGSTISIPIKHIYDNDDNNTTYLLCHNALFVLLNGKIVTHCMVDGWLNDETLHSFGDLGFGKGYDFVAIEYMAHGCGEMGGDEYYLWDGERLRHFCLDYGIGDGGLSEGVSYVFPASQDGIPNSLIRTEYASEMIKIIPLTECEEKYADAIDYQISSILSYVDDTLIEVQSKYLDLEQLIQKTYPTYKLSQSTYGDLNSDGIEDVVFQIIKEKYNESQYTYKTKVGIALGTSAGALEVFNVNEHIIGDTEPSAVLFNNNSIIITSYVVSNTDEWGDNIYSRKIYYFTYNAVDRKLYWDSVSIVDEDGLHKSTFKTKKVLFENAWNFEIENEQEY